jgi:hypothetical protein
MPFGKVSEADMGDVLKLAGHLEEAHSDSIFHMCRQNRLPEVKGMLEGAPLHIPAKFHLLCHRHRAPVPFLSLNSHRARRGVRPGHGRRQDGRDDPVHRVQERAQKPRQSCAEDGRRHGR